MKIIPLNINNEKQGVRFRGSKTPDVTDFETISRFANKSLSNLYSSLITSIKKENENLIIGEKELEHVANDTLKRKIDLAAKSFFCMPLDVLDGVAKKFPNSKLNNAKFLNDYRVSVAFDDNVRAARGIQENTVEFIKKYPEEGDGKKLNEFVTEQFNKLANDKMAYDIADYDTKKERFATRLTSGFTAAVFLGNDFYNKSIQKGKSPKEAKKEQHLKQGQEIKENICEAVAQFAVFACFSKQVNKSVWAPAIIGAAIGLVSRVISRVSSNIPLTRIKVPEKQKLLTMPVLNFENFIKSAKEGKAKDLSNNSSVFDINCKEDNKQKKKPILSMQNILAFCALSIAGGYSLRFLKNNTKIGKEIAEKLKQHSENFKSRHIKDVDADLQTLNRLSNVLAENKQGGFSNDLRQAIHGIKKTSGKASIGTDFKTIKLFGKIELRTMDLEGLLTAPLKFAKELISYPYKIAVKLEEAVKNSKIIAKGGKIPEKPKPTGDKFNIKNLYKRFLDYEKMYGDDEKKLSEEFGKYIKKMQLLSNNGETSSKNDNSKIAVIAQTLGTLTGMWFNMNDEFNASVRNGSTKEEAEKDARLRGINKFFRMTVQIIISGSLNNIFAKQYNDTITKSALVVAASTILTDAASRVLTGMPSKKMTKEELDKYQKEHKEGAMAWYYKLIDKLAS